MIVKYRNATQEVGVDRFVAMVLAKRLYMSSEVEVLKAESIMIRTDVYRLMGCLLYTSYIVYTYYYYYGMCGSFKH